MQTEISDVLWLSRTESVSLADLAALAGFTESEIRELVESGALAPADPQAPAWTFSADCIVTVRQASRLRHDLELDIHALALALRLLERIRALESELSGLRARRASLGTD